MSSNAIANISTCTPTTVFITRLAGAAGTSQWWGQQNGESPPMVQELLSHLLTIRQSRLLVECARIL